MVKIAPAKADAFAVRPDPALRAVLVYGGDAGLVRERAEAMARATVDDPNDPFAVVALQGDELRQTPAALVDGAAELPLGGGRRLVRVRDVGDAAAPAFEALLANDAAEGFVIAEAGELASRSKLRQLFEKADRAAALPCYVDDARALVTVIRGHLERENLSVGEDALAFLVDRLGGDRMLTRSELDKLATYKGSGDDRVVRLADAEACVGDSALVSLDAVAMSCCGGDRKGLERALARARDEGIAPVTVIRAVASHLQRLHLVKNMAARGEDLDAAMARLRPPVFFKVRDGFRAQVRSWSAVRLVRAMDLAVAAEVDSKSSGLPAGAVVERAVMRIAQAARQA